MVEQPQTDPPPRNAKWFYDRWFVLAMLFLLLGPAALPLLWKSPKFSTPWKIILTVVVLILTLALIAACYATIMYALAQFQAA